MRQIKNHSLSQLLMQLKFTPIRKRQEQLVGAEKLLGFVEKDKEYPFEFVCYHITGYRPKHIAGLPLMKGDELAEDLRIFISKLSSQIADKADEQDEKVYTVEELADELRVSTKTINRWRKRGLIARKFLFSDGKKRLGFLQSVLDDFLKKNPQLVEKASDFSRLTKKGKTLIIEKAGMLSANTSLSRYQIIERIASEMGKAHETIRYILLNYEKENPGRQIFERPAGVVDSSQSAEIYRLFRQGCDIKELMERFNRNKSSIYRIINVRRAKAILARKVEFIDSDEFVEESSKERILGKPLDAIIGPLDSGIEPFDLQSDSLTKYMRTLRRAPALNRDTEIVLFRRYNYLKYLVCVKKAGIKPTVVSSVLINEIEDYLSEAEKIKKIIIEANLRLVISIASKHASNQNTLSDLISEGNISLMRAVEKFDYTKGFRFGTYASWAIAKDYARKIPAEAARLDRTTTTALTNVQRDLRTATAAGVEAVERARRSLVHVIRDNLNEREQYIILYHFGLTGTLIRKNKKTLKQIGDDLGLSKERVRQIELLALQKLKHFLSVEEFEMLTG